MVAAKKIAARVYEKSLTSRKIGEQTAQVMMMEVKEFSQLPLREQLIYVQESGRYLHARLKGWCHISLYHVGSFYAEVWLLEHCGSIAMVRTFTSQQQLDPYLQTTSMESLLKELV